MKIGYFFEEEYDSLDNFYRILIHRLLNVYDMFCFQNRFLLLVFYE